MHTYNLQAFHFAREIDLKAVRESYTGKLLANLKSELFYQVSEDEFLYIFDYGQVVFTNFRPEDVSKTLAFLAPFCEDVLPQRITEEHRIVKDEKSAVIFGYDELIVPNFTPELIRIAMFVIAQSAALDYYAQVADQLLKEIRFFTRELEQKGKVSLSKKSMMRFIGKSLTIKNGIIENLYIFESPNMVWENEYLDKVNVGMSKQFEIQSRFRELEYSISYIDDNLEVYRDLMHHRESSTLEWIIIILILVEVVDMIISKF